VLATLAVGTGAHQDAAHLFGAAQAFCSRTGQVRFKIYDAAHDTSLATLREAMGDNEFADAWSEGAALSTEEAIAYAQRGRGERKRPSTGWESLTPAELNVVKLVSEGLPNKDIAERLFLSPHRASAPQSRLLQTGPQLESATRPRSFTARLKIPASIGFVVVGG